MLLRRDNLSNVPIDVNDDRIISKQTISRKLSSETSYKHKAKFQKPSPEQQFDVGDLVMLRGGLSKNTPRETYIIDSMPSNGNQLILVRKLSNSLRPKLYQARPDELIHHPSTDPSFSKTPKRKAAVKANAKIKNCLHNVSLVKSKFKHGWIEDDQPLEFDDFTLVQTTQVASGSLDLSDHIHPLPNPNQRSRSSSSGSNGSDNSSQDLAWDDTPSQYTLTPPPSVITTEPPISPIPSSTPFLNAEPVSIPPFTRSRLFASTDPAISRTPAFRNCRSNQAFLISPQTDSPNVLPRAPTKKSRIPLPLSPSTVDSNQVQDLSVVLPALPPLRRSTRPSLRPDYYGTSAPYKHKNEEEEN